MRKAKYFLTGVSLALVMSCCTGCGTGDDTAVAAVTEPATKSLSDQLVEAALADDGSVEATEFETRDRTDEPNPIPQVTEAPASSGGASGSSGGSSGSSGSSGGSSGGSAGSSGSSGDSSGSSGSSGSSSGSSGGSSGGSGSSSGSSGDSSGSSGSSSAGEKKPATKEECESALAAAREYVADYQNADGETVISPISWKTVVLHLQSKGFSESAAEYGADNCGGDWNKMAVMAATLCKQSGFSHEGMIEALQEDYYFTAEQAAYGVDNADINWNAQAKRAAKIQHGYDIQEGVTRTQDEVIECLINEWYFSRAQAEYGVTGY